MSLADKWNKTASEKLLNKTIVEVRYTTTQENENLGWYSSGLVLIMNDGSNFWVQSDDEGNGPGALYYATPDGSEGILPVI
jgi:hypothetical protein